MQKSSRKPSSFPGAVQTEPTKHDIERALYEIFEGMEPEELLATLEEFDQMDRDLVARGPQNPDELWDWISDNLGVQLTRHKVCEDHEAPFDVLCDMYFEEEFDWPHPQQGTRRYGGVGSILVMANRGGSKTFLVALLHFLNSTFKPGCEGLTFGATEEQSKRCYNHLTPWVTVVKPDTRTGKKKRGPRDGIDYSQRSETVWEAVDDAVGVPRASKVEILSGTPEAVNGPHPNVAHADEVELMRDDTWAESRNMAVAGKDAWGRPIRTRNIGTSTRKSKHGRMQGLIDEIKKAMAQGFKPTFTLCVWCIWETAAQVSNCRMAPENAGEDDEFLCDCNRVPKGVWDDGTTRTLDQVCEGKLFKSRGWQPLEQVQELFSQNARPVWEAQQECREPETENNYIQGWRPERTVIHNWDPDPSLGPIFTSVDWGAGNPNAFNWYQFLYYEVEAIGYDWRPIYLPAGSFVVFDEIYSADIGAGKLGKMVVERENRWRRLYPDFRVHSRFYDPAGRQQLLDFRDGSGLNLQWWPGSTRDVQTGIDLAVDLHEGRWGDYVVTEPTRDGRLRNVPLIYAADSNEVQQAIPEEEMACPMWRLEVEFWRKNPKTGLELPELNHCMANWRYFLVNMQKGVGKYVSSPGIVQAKEDTERRVRRIRSGARSGPLRFGGRQQSHVVAEFGSRPMS